MNKNLIYVLWFLLGILLIVFLFFEYKKNMNDKEYFDNQVEKVEEPINVRIIKEEEVENKPTIHIERGVIENKGKGSVVFEKPFDEEPNILTQVITVPGEKPSLSSVIVYNVSKTGFDFAEQTIGVKEVLEETDEVEVGDEEAENVGPNPPMKMLDFIEQLFAFQWVAMEKTE